MLCVLNGRERRKKTQITFKKKNVKIQFMNVAEREKQVNEN